MKKKSIPSKSTPSTQPLLGNALTILSGLLFLFLCMILPLVGPAGQAVEHAAANFWFFLLMLLLTLACSAGAFWFKWMLRQQDGSPFPRISAGLTAVCTLLLFALLLGLLKI